MSRLAGQFETLYQALNVGGSGGGGFSVNANTGATPKGEGVMVSKDKSEEQIPQSEVTPGRIQKYAGSKDFSGSYDHLGGWNPGGGADVSLDMTRRVMPGQDVKRTYGNGVARANAMTSALDIGIMEKQEAVFRLSDMSTHRTGIKTEDISRRKD